MAVLVFMSTGDRMLPVHTLHCLDPDSKNITNLNVPTPIRLQKWQFTKVASGSAQKVYNTDMNTFLI